MMSVALRRQWLATFDLGDLDGEVLDRVDAANEGVAQGLAARFGSLIASIAVSSGVRLSAGEESKDLEHCRRVVQRRTVSGEEP